MTKRTVIEIGSDRQMTLIEDNDTTVMHPVPAPSHASIETDDWQVMFTVDGDLRIRWKDQETRLSTFGRSGLLVLRTPESQANANIGVNKNRVFGDGSVARRSLIRAVFLSGDEDGNEEVVNKNYVA